MTKSKFLQRLAPCGTPRFARVKPSTTGDPPPHQYVNQPLVVSPDAGLSEGSQNGLRWKPRVEEEAGDFGTSSVIHVFEPDPSAGRWWWHTRGYTSDPYASGEEQPPLAREESQGSKEAREAREAAAKTAAANQQYILFSDKNKPSPKLTSIEEGDKHNEVDLPFGVIDTNRSKPSVYGESAVSDCSKEDSSIELSEPLPQKAGIVLQGDGSDSAGRKSGTSNDDTGKNQVNKRTINIDNRKSSCPPSCTRSVKSHLIVSTRQVPLGQSPLQKPKSYDLSGSLQSSQKQIHRQTPTLPVHSCDERTELFTGDSTTPSIGRSDETKQLPRKVCFRYEPPEKMDMAFSKKTSQKKGPPKTPKKNITRRDKALPTPPKYTNVDIICGVAMANRYSRHQPDTLSRKIITQVASSSSEDESNSEETAPHEKPKSSWEVFEDHVKKIDNNDMGFAQKQLTSKSSDLFEKVMGEVSPHYRKPEVKVSIRNENSKSISSDPGAGTRKQEPVAPCQKKPKPVSKTTRFASRRGWNMIKRTVMEIQTASKTGEAALSWKFLCTTISNMADMQRGREDLYQKYIYEPNSWMEGFTDNPARVLRNVNHRSPAKTGTVRPLQRTNGEQTLVVGHRPDASLTGEDRPIVEKGRHSLNTPRCR